MRQFALTSAIGVIALMSVCKSALASDCDFFIGQIENLKAACASGSYCEDLEAFKQRARSEGCLPGDTSSGVRARPNPPPVVIAKPAPAPPNPPKKDNCATIPTDLEFYKMVVALKYSAKLQALNDGLATLRQQRSELESSFNFEIGGVGSIRSSVTYMAAITKTTADLINDILGYLPQGKLVNTSYQIFKWKLSSREVYEAISKGKLVKESVDEDAWQAIIDISLEAIEVNPAVATAKLLNDIQKNARELKEMPDKFDIARKEYDRTLQTLDRQIAGLAKKISDAKATSLQSGGEALLKRYMEVRSMCLSTAGGEPELKPLR